LAAAVTVTVVSPPTSPSIERLTLARVTAVPDWHPARATFEPFPVHAWVVRYRDEVILVDTGIGTGNQAIDEWYRPEVVSLRDALASVRLEPADVTAVVLSHLHFDHCRQQRMLGAPVFVQATEHTEARDPGYTIADWAAIPANQLRLVHGDEEISAGIRLVATPGHTPGHQSVVIQTREAPVVLAAQCAFRAGELLSGEPDARNLHDESWREAARISLALDSRGGSRDRAPEPRPARCASALSV
jgi:glyoxylase-like metal-dependent hydrolase (beta-lactamase superfamily II)